MTTLFVLFAAFLSSLGLTRLLVDRPIQGLISYRDGDPDSPVPLTGGAAIFLASWPLTLVLCDRSFLMFFPLAMFAVGVRDDAEPFAWREKLYLQALIAWTLTWYGYRLAWAGGWVSVPSVLLWLVLLPNAYNLSDNSDGLCGGLVSVSCVGAWAATGRIEFPILAGAVAGFLVFNVVGRVWMGDAGSLYLGLTLALLIGEYVASPLAALLLVFVPILDTTYVSVARTVRGSRPWRGGRDHLSHELARRCGKGAALGLLWGLQSSACFVAWFVVRAHG